MHSLPRKQKKGRYLGDERKTQKNKPALGKSHQHNRALSLNLISSHAITHLILIKDLERIRQNRIQHSGLQTRIRDLRSRMTSHQTGCKANSQIARGHSVLSIMLLDAVEMQHYCAQSGVIRVRQFVDNGMDSIAAGSVVVDAGGVYEAVVGAAGE